MYTMIQIKFQTIFSDTDQVIDLNNIDSYNLLICNKLFFGMILNLQVHKNSKLIIIYINRIKIIN